MTVNEAISKLKEKISSNPIIEKDISSVIVKLDDAIIMETDENGEEKLRLIADNNKRVKIRFPTYGNWDNYVQDLYKLMMMLSVAVGDLEVSNIADFSVEKYSNWAQLVGIALQYKKISKHAEKMFLKYLRPSVDNVSDKNIKNWMRENMGFDVVFKMFIAILMVEEWVKKKSTFYLQTMFQRGTQLPSTQNSTKNSDGHPTESTILQFSKSVSF